MEFNEALRCCRYYKGEANIPEGVPTRFWRYEAIWVQSVVLHPNSLSGLIDEYNNAGLMEFNKGDGVPISLKAVLYNRWLQWIGPSDIEGFKKWYKNYVNAD